MHDTWLLFHVVFDELIQLRMKGEVVAQICCPSKDLISIDLHCLAYIQERCYCCSEAREEWVLHCYTGCALPDIAVHENRFGHGFNLVDNIVGVFSGEIIRVLQCTIWVSSASNSVDCRVLWLAPDRISDLVTRLNSVHRLWILQYRLLIVILWQTGKFEIQIRENNSKK